LKVSDKIANYPLISVKVNPADMDDLFPAGVIVPGGMAHPAVPLSA
jgi:hypothetical protein